MIIHTVGYGNSSIQDFIRRLTEHEINHVYDIRREGSRGWCTEYNQGPRMSKLLAEYGYAYSEFPFLANHSETLEKYGEWLLTKEGAKAVTRGALLLYASGQVFKKSSFFTDEMPCLLCCERLPENCHRSLVAKAMVDYAKTEGIYWTVEHIE